MPRMHRRWGRVGKERPPLVESLQAAFAATCKVRLVYGAGRHGGRPSERLVDPWGLVDKDDIWYLVAGTDGGQRTFRLDRVVDAEVTDVPAERPEVDLAEAWRRVVDEVEQRRSGASATVLVEPWLVRGLRLSFGRHLDVTAEEPDGRLRASVAAQSTTAVAEQLAGWATLVEVVGPPEVVSELARIGAELVARYGA